MKVLGFTHDTNYSEYLRFSDAKAYGLNAIGERRFPKFSGYKYIRTAEMMHVAAQEWMELNPGKNLPAVFRAPLSDQDRYLSRNKMFHLRHLSLETLRLYNGGDCHLTKMIEVSNKKHVPQALMQLYIDLGYILHAMEPVGPLFDFEQCEKLLIVYPAKEKVLKARLRKLLKDENYNPGSAPQVFNALYKKLKLQYPFEGKPNTRKMAMLMLGREHKFPRLQLAWRKASRVESTLKGYHRCATANGGRLRTRWWATGTRTGRLSSGGDKDRKTSTLINLQNIKKDAQVKNLCVADAEWQKFYNAAAVIVKQYPDIRKHWAQCKAAAKGVEPKLPSSVKQQMLECALALEKYVREHLPGLGTYLVLDYGQVEVRVAAQMSGDENLIADCQEADIHTTVGVAMTGWDADRIKNDEAIRTLTKNCIAHGQRVLTDQGLVPIQEVTKSMLVWDGVEFVHHDGVVDSGIQEVITYHGLTATKDHEVWTGKGKLPFGKAQATRSKLIITGDKETPIRYAGDSLGNIQSRQLSRGGRCLFRLWETVRSVCRQYLVGPVARLCVSTKQEIRRSTSFCTSRKILSYSTTLRQSGQSELGELRRSWYLQPIPDTGSFCGIYAEETTTSNIQGRGNRSEEQQRSLCAGQSSVSNEERQRTEQEKQCLREIQGCSDGSYRSSAAIEARVPEYVLPDKASSSLMHGCVLEEANSVQGTRPIQKVRVYDILNAGPRHRFTVEGCLVSNCHFGILFGISKKNLFKFVVAMSPPEMRDKITQQEVEDAYDRYFERYSGIRQFIQDQRAFAREYKYVETLFGMRQLLNVTEDSSEEDSLDEFIDPDEVGQGKAYWGNQAINGPVQGTAHQLMICALVNLIRKKKKYKVLGIPTMEVHDALYFRVAVLELLEAYAKAKYLLEKESLNTVASDFPAIDWKVPITVDAKAGIRLGCLVKVNEKSTVGGFLLDWFRLCRDQIKELDAELEAVA